MEGRLGYQPVLFPAQSGTRPLLTLIGRQPPATTRALERRPATRRGGACCKVSLNAGEAGRLKKQLQRDTVAGAAAEARTLGAHLGNAPLGAAPQNLAVRA
ncbi:hypothetical protein NDU88_004146 [Pleurodeles waltl]|uniref:Uncharacterized protein n=1 Tax=Pleurodeles waltl TaxID=8319 RepID=A0AAV7VHU9_PLEWA|nr:hypothetical protein NDU88_004146 [Pleurodeles waltl]